MTDKKPKKKTGTKKPKRKKKVLAEITPASAGLGVVPIEGQTHRDGHKLNGSLTILADAPDTSDTAPHHYIVVGDGDEIFATVQYQHGTGAGVTDPALLAIVLDRYLSFQQIEPCPENAMVILRLSQALRLMKAQADAAILSAPDAQDSAAPHAL